MSPVKAAPYSLDMQILVLSAAGSLGALWAYVLIIGVLDETIFGISVRLGYVALAVVGGFGAFIWLVRRALRAEKVSQELVQNASIAIAVMVLGMLFLDVAYSSYLNLEQPKFDNERLTDENSWIGELYPDLYYPTQKNFRLHKPNRTIAGSHYGDMYKPVMLASPTLATSVLSHKHVTISINDEGFRETRPLDGQKVLAIGDSFTFGWGIDQGRTWVELLEQSIGKSIYNLGMQDSSPKQELLLLDNLLESKKLDFRHGLLLWMIFEGNDLEDSYDTLRPRGNSKRTARRMFADTLVEALWDAPSIIKRESVIDKFRTGRIMFSHAITDANQSNPYVIDGVQSTIPLYRSQRFGLKLFHPEQIERARSTREYVVNHPNRVRLQETFESMVALAGRYDFRVIVLIAPTDARMYALFFDDFPALSEQPYFNDLVAELAGQSGFEVFNLQTLMQPYAQKDLLYFRDDDHWNERGHEVVAEIIARSLATSQARPL